MAAAETARLMASMDLDTRKFDKGIAKTQKSLGLLGHTVSTALGVGLANVASKGISALSGAIGDGIQGALTLEKAMAQTQAVITSTGGKAGVTAQQVRDMANSLEDVTTADDKAIQQGENLLLTFTGIGKDVFPQATKAMVNLGIAMNKGDASTADFDASAVQLGKALNDPVKGITALRKVGVSFTDQQQKQIKALVKAGKLQEAQKVILAELATEFGKAGEAAGTGFAADISRANDAIDDAKITIAQGLLPALGDVARELSTTFKDPQVQAGLKDLGKGIGDVIKGGVAFAKTVPWDKIASSLRTAAGFAKDLLNAFLGLPSWVQVAVVTGWGLNKLTGGAVGSIVGQLASGLIKGVLGINAGVVNVNAATVGGLPGAGGVGGAAATGLSTIQKVFLVGEAIGLAVAVKTVADNISTASSAQATAINDQTSQFIATQPNRASIETALAGVNQGIHDLEFNPLNVFVQGDALDQLRAMRAKLQAALIQKPVPTNAGPVLIPGQKPSAVQGPVIVKQQLQDAFDRAVIPVAHTQDIADLKGKLSDDLDTVKVATARADSNITSAATTAGIAAANASRSGASSIVGAIQANRPIIDVAVNISATTIQRTVTVTNRTGTPNPSRTSNGGGTAGNGGQ